MVHRQPSLILILTSPLVQQALAVAFTERETIGGRVWPNVMFSDKRFDYVFSIWGNSTLGLLSHWWHSSRQQSSKGTMADSLPVTYYG